MSEASSTAGSSATPANATADERSKLRSQAHVTSEKKRRANINTGFEELRAAVPGCHEFHSKADVLRRAVNYIRSLAPRRRDDDMRRAAAVMSADAVAAPPSPLSPTAPLLSAAEPAAAVRSAGMASMSAGDSAALLNELPLAWLAGGAAVPPAAGTADEANLHQRLALAVNYIEYLKRQKDELRLQLETLKQQQQQLQQSAPPSPPPAAAGASFTMPAPAVAAANAATAAVWAPFARQASSPYLPASAQALFGTIRVGAPKRRQSAAAEKPPSRIRALNPKRPKAAAASASSSSSSLSGPQ